MRARDAICDAVRDARGTKPMPPERGTVADLPLFVTAYHDRWAGKLGWQWHAGSAVCALLLVFVLLLPMQVWMPPSEAAASHGPSSHVLKKYLKHTSAG